jgi:hypothetical protein
MPKVQPENIPDIPIFTWAFVLAGVCVLGMMYACTLLPRLSTPCIMIASAIGYVLGRRVVRPRNRKDVEPRTHKEVEP